MLAPLLLAALPSPFAPQDPPCLGPFQTLEPFGGTAPVEVIKGIAVDGPRAGAPTLRRNDPDARLHIFEQDATGTWSATSSFVAQDCDSWLRLDGDHIAYTRGLGLGGVVVRRRDPATDTWPVVATIPAPPSSPATLESVQLDGERVAIGRAGLVEVWGPDSGGNYALEATIVPDPGRLDFLPHDMDAGRLVVRRAFESGSAFELFRRSPSGTWASEALVPLPAELSPDPTVRPMLRGGYLAARMLSTQFAFPLGDGVSMWRVGPDDRPLSSIFEGWRHEGADGNRFADSDGRQLPGGALGTVVQAQELPGCGAADPRFRPLAVYSVIDGEVQLEGEICALAGSTGPGESRRLAYDGRTLAVAVPFGAGIPRNSVQFASLLAIDLDNDRDCVADAIQIAQDPSLDRNGNGRLDSAEVRGRTFCPATSGEELRLVGNEFANSTDLVAIASGLDPNALVLCLTTTAAGAGPPASAIGLCLGDGPVGRYAPTLAGPDGVAVFPLTPEAIPTPGGPVAAQPGDVRVWQCVFRSAGGVAATNAAAVTLF